jgi:uncharacterized protein YutE (UPF0331/DUF86 family)
VTPRFSADVVQAKLVLMRSVLRDLESVGEVSTECLLSDAIVRAAVERFLGQLVDLAVGVNVHIAATLLDDVPTDYRATFQAASTVGAIPADLAEKLAPSVGLRNALVHEYVGIDPAKVASAVPLALTSTVATSPRWRASCSAGPRARHNCGVTAAGDSTNLALALDMAEPGGRILLVGYGAGSEADALSFTAGESAGRGAVARGLPARTPGAPRAGVRALRAQLLAAPGHRPRPDHGGVRARHARAADPAPAGAAAAQDRDRRGRVGPADGGRKGVLELI